jgi:hypothetical protein
METTYKLQPTRTLHLQGASGFGAAAALHSATETGFKVSGIFRDPADFAVLVLWDRDDFFGHPRFSYLPDGDFSGIALTFDLHYENLQPIDSPKYPTIDWPFLNCLKTDGTLVQLRLFDRAEQVGGTYAKAEGAFTLVDNGLQPYDRVTLWYQNIAFDYIVPEFTTSCVQAMWWQGNPNYLHWVQIGNATYSVLEDALSSAQIAQAIAAQINANDPYCEAATGGQYGNEITITLRAGQNGPVNVSSSDGSAPATLQRITASLICQAIADQINGFDWQGAGVLIPLEAEASGETLTIRAARPGEDGNMIRLYELHRNTNLYFTPHVLQLQGGSSDATWRITINFSAEGLTDLQKIWMTLAPKLADSAAYEPQEWQATFSNWTVSDTLGKRALKVAGPGSVRIEEDDAWASYSGYWEWAPANWWSRGRAKRAAQQGATATVETHCSAVHDIYLGTRLDFDCGIVEARLDGGGWVQLDCYEIAARARQVRRKLFSNVSAGQHTVEIRLTGSKNPDSQGWYFYFDFLECAVPSDVPDAPELRTDVAVACDYGTDHTWKLPPQRLIWAIRKLGLIGEINHYVSVFWWNQRKRVGGFFPSVTVTYGGTWQGGDEAFLTIGGTTIGKSVFPADTPETIAEHFAYYINAVFVGVWAQASDAVLTVTVRSPAYSFSFSESHNSAQGTVTVEGSLSGGVMGDWVIDDSATPVLNRAARDWHADYFAELAGYGMSCVAAFSQELVLPPDDPPDAVWIARYPDGEPVLTATGFGSLYSAHCTFAPPVRDYIKRAYQEMAALMEAAGITARLQFDEVLWWYFANSSGMAYYDAYTTARFYQQNGRSLHVFQTPNDDPSVNGYVDANFLRQMVKDHVDAIRAHVLTSHPNARFELLWPLDVNDPTTRRLNRYVNLPPEWETKDGSGLDTFAIEGHQFAGLDRNLDKVRWMAGYPFRVLSWLRSACRYLMGNFNAGWPFERDYLNARRTRVPLIKIWAYDHLCLFARRLPMPSDTRTHR